MKVRAIRTGYYGDRRRREGTIFSMPASMKLPSWVVELDDEPGTPPTSAATREDDEVPVVTKKSKKARR